MTMNLDAAIRLIQRVTRKNDLWTGADISEDAKTATDAYDAIATILNAVVAGELAPPATECPFGDDCDLTVAYMAGAASKKPAADKDATIARLTEERDRLSDINRKLCSDFNRLNLDGARLEAKLAEVTKERDAARAEGFAQGIEAAAAFVDGFAPFNRIEGFPDMIRALSPTPQADPVREAVEMARNRLECIADEMISGFRDGGLVGGRELKRSLAGVFAEYDALAQKEPTND